MIKKAITLKLVIALCLFQIATFGQSTIQDNIKSGLRLSGNSAKMSFYENFTKNENTPRKFDIHIGAGVSPFKMLVGIGYFLDNNFESTLKFSSIYSPLSIEANLVSIGIKYYENQFSTITYSFEIGGLFSKTTQSQSNNLNGVSLEANFGYLFQTKIGIYISPNLNLTYLSEKRKEPGFLPGINLLLGWILIK